MSNRRKKELDVRSDPSEFCCQKEIRPARRLGQRRLRKREEIFEDKNRSHLGLMSQSPCNVETKHPSYASVSHLIPFLEGNAFATWLRTRRSRK